VNSALWEYVHTRRLAEEEDEYFRDHPLFQTDARLLDERFVNPAPLVDLGCGAGRHAIRFARRGFPVFAVDLSHAMLQTTNAKALNRSMSLLCVEANLCRLGCLPDASFQYALSMFSTLGMIRGAEARTNAVREAYRILRPGGRLALHAHNLWLNLRDPQGRLWLLGQGFKALGGRAEIGDRKMTYRGIPGMEVHLFRWREVRREIVSAGFRIDEVIPIDEIRAQPIRAPWLAHNIRAGGWMIFATRQI
jgi:SAM-dependent methyltransferase